jgi:hypothetical protein
LEFGEEFTESIIKERQSVPAIEAVNAWSLRRQLSYVPDMFADSGLAALAGDMNGRIRQFMRNPELEHVEWSEPLPFDWTTLGDTKIFPFRNWLTP